MRRFAGIAAAAGLTLFGCASELGELIDHNPASSPSPGASGTSSPQPTGTPPPNFVFVSSVTYQGNDIQTTIGGDALCSTLADPTTAAVFVAWLSASSADALDRVNDVGPWMLFDGTVVFADKAAITSGPAVPIDQDESGNNVGTVEVWTGTDANGLVQGDDCTNWTTNGGQGRFGMSNATDATWTSSTSSNCSGTRHLYCLSNE